MNTKAILLTGLCTVLGASGCQSIGHQNRNLAIQAGLAPTQQLSLAELQLARGRAYLDSELTTLAIGQFRLAEQDPQTTAAASNGLGVAYARLGRHDLAERYFSQAVAAEPGSERYVRNLAMLRDNRPALANLAPKSQLPSAADAPTTTDARSGVRLVRLSRGEVHIGGSASTAPDVLRTAKLASNDGQAVITVIAPRRPRPAYPVVVKLDQLPGLMQARTEQRALAMNLLAPALPRPKAGSPQPARAVRKGQVAITTATYPIVVDLSR